MGGLEHCGAGAAGAGSIRSQEALLESGGERPLTYVLREVEPTETQTQKPLNPTRPLYDASLPLSHSFALFFFISTPYISLPNTISYISFPLSLNQEQGLSVLVAVRAL